MKKSFALLIVIITIAFASQAQNTWSKKADLRRTARWNAAGSFALQFDGVRQWVSLKYWDMSDLTLESWVKLDSSGSGGPFLNRQEDLMMGVSNGKAFIQLELGGANWRILYSAQTLLPGTWYHVAGTYDHSAMRIYINGQLDGELAATGTLFRDGCTDYWSIGAAYDRCSNRYFTFFAGTVDEIRVWDYARNQSEIQSTLYTSLTGHESGLVGYWPLDEGSGQIAKDLSLHGRDGTLGSGNEMDINDPVWVSLCDSGLIVYADADSDGYGNPADSTINPTCDLLSGYVLNNTDCNDANAKINPGAKEVINGIDDNCNGAIDDIIIRSDPSWVYSNNLESGWNEANFNDAGWEPVIVLGTGGFGDPDVSVIWGDHPGSNPSIVYMRKTFVLGESIPEMALDHGQDDDADVYVNGVLVSSDHNTYAGPDIFNVYITPYLIANATNVIAVKAIDTYCCGYLFYLRTHEPVCPEPANLRVSKISDTCAKLNWKEPALGVNHVRIIYRPLGSSEWSTGWRKAEHNGFYINNLVPNTTYEWKLKNICSEAKSAWVSGPNFTTLSSISFSSNATIVPGSEVEVNKNVWITPNPNKGNFTLQMQLPGKAASTRLLLYNSFGEKVWQQDAGNISGSFIRNIVLESKLSAGVYVVIIQRNDTRLMQKLLVTK